MDHDGNSVLDNPRLQIIFGDAHAWLHETNEIFDVIIMDVSDPVEGGPGVALYTQNFYQHAVTRLTLNRGVFVTQAGVSPAAPRKINRNFSGDETCLAPIRNTLGSVFDCAMLYRIQVPSFGSEWGFVMAFSLENQDDKNQYRVLDAAIIDRLISLNINNVKEALKQ